MTKKVLYKPYAGAIPYEIVGAGGEFLSPAGSLESAKRQANNWMKTTRRQSVEIMKRVGYFYKK